MQFGRSYIPEDKPYNEIVPALISVFPPKSLLIAECFHFYKRVQRTGESVAMYMAELRRLSLHCRFDAYHDQALRDRLVCGLRNESTQRSLLVEAYLSLAKVMDIAQGRKPLNAMQNYSRTQG